MLHSFACFNPPKTKSKKVTDAIHIIPDGDIIWHWFLCCCKEEHIQYSWKCYPKKTNENMGTTIQCRTTLKRIMRNRQKVRYPNLFGGVTPEEVHKTNEKYPILFWCVTLRRFERIRQKLKVSKSIWRWCYPWGGSFLWHSKDILKTIEQFWVLRCYPEEVHSNDILKTF